MDGILREGTLVRFIRRDEDDTNPNSITLGKIYPLYKSACEGDLVALPTDDGTDYYYYLREQVELMEETKADGFDTP